MAVTILGAIPGAKPKIFENGSGLILEQTYPANQQWEESEVEHLHPHQDEYYEIVEGLLSARVAGEERTYVSGETFVIPRAIPHRVCNLSSKPVRVVLKVWPAMTTGVFVETIHALKNEGKMGSLLQQAVVAWEYRHVIKPQGRSLWLQPLSIAVLALTGMLLGYTPFKYS